MFAALNTSCSFDADEFFFYTSVVPSLLNNAMFETSEGEFFMPL